MLIDITRLSATEDFAKQCAKTAVPGDVIYLLGGLGAGKTTFARFFLRQLGVEGPVKSPTYTIVEPYDQGQWSLYHFDLYRLQDPDELFEIGLESYFDGDSICLIEWPEHGAGVLPPATKTYQFNVGPQNRTVTIKE